jgi:copper chaperone
MTRTETLTIAGMSCGHCVAAVRTALESVDGLTVEDVRVGEARVRYDDEAVGPDAVVRAVEEEGYAVHP